MSKPYVHAQSSARRYGGKPEDYVDIHEAFDQTKAFVPDLRHRAIFHSSFGIFHVAHVFGRTRTNSAGKEYDVRDVGEHHVLEDLGFIPTMGQWLQKMPVEHWMAGRRSAPRPREDRPRAPEPTEKELFDLIFPTLMQDGPLDTKATQIAAAVLRRFKAVVAPQEATEPEEVEKDPAAGKVAA